VRSTTAIIKVRWHATGGQGGHFGSVAGLLDYVQGHDRHPDLERTEDVEGLTRYVAWRDQASPQARLFDAEQTVGDAERAALANFVERSVAGMGDSAAWRVRQNRKAFYHVIISPEDAHGLDLRRATRSAVRQLERDAGTGGLPPWIGAEHHNTEHPHVHVVLAARREMSGGRYRRLDIPQARLERMHQALNADLVQQREERALLRSSALRAVEVKSKSSLQTMEPPSVVHRSSAVVELSLADSTTGPDAMAIGRRPSWDLAGQAGDRAGRLAGRLARHYLRQAEQEARRRQRESRDGDRGRGE
jgi:hypothetical protein